MPPKRRAASLELTIWHELAGHAIMGTALGLCAAFVLAFVDKFGIARLIAHDLEPHLTFAVFVGMFTLVFAVGATLTGFVFTMMDKR
ncbi:conserved hypothetical protein [Bradyrhizobium sp. STM 3843]|uniref:hypothetical protein n=1 Tax=Bradyrhizobium sp. STM 3843 TaxID=551947 RepID=UPI0002403497|nr:hypothetical protein [Bradyrhizobium sp. STM 3843]CCE11347.1 conserved hypothetical protein [Bradyrhizobium sp. STM 3843]